jgi:hypothetical protein
VRARTGLVALVTLVVAAAVACAPTTTSRSGSAAPPAGAGQHATHPAAPTAAAKASPTQVRAQFEQLLGQHALLAVRLMRSVVQPSPDGQATTASLGHNTDALTKIVAAAYGSVQADRFKQLWQEHIADLSSYAKGVAGRDESAKQTARDALLAYCDAYGSWFAGASKGRVGAGDAADGVRMHVQELMNQLDAYAARDYAQAYRIERAAYQHMFSAGATLAKASITPELAVGLDAPPEKLRSAFAMLLGEHLELIVEAQRATFARAPEFTAAAAQVNANTTALTQALAAIVGPKKAAEFQAAWADHVEGLIGYTTAAATGDQASKATAEKTLNRAVVTLVVYFNRVVPNQLDPVALTGALTMHDTHLIDHANAYAAKDYDRAERLERDGYRQMLGVANALVDAIQRSVRPGLPVGGSQTGGGGTAHCRR